MLGLKSPQVDKDYSQSHLQRFSHTLQEAMFSGWDLKFFFCLSPESMQLFPNQLQKNRSVLCMAASESLYECPQSSQGRGAIWMQSIYTIYEWLSLDDRPSLCPTVVHSYWEGSFIDNFLNSNPFVLCTFGGIHFFPRVVLRWCWLSSMIISEAVVCVAFELLCVMLTGVSIILSTTFISKRGAK